jgi:hypothetical protein
VVVVDLLLDASPYGVSVLRSCDTLSEVPSPDVLCELELESDPPMPL